MDTLKTYQDYNKELDEQEIEKSLVNAKSITEKLMSKLHKIAEDIVKNKSKKPLKESKEQDKTIKQVNKVINEWLIGLGYGTGAGYPILYDYGNLAKNYAQNQIKEPRDGEEKE